MIAYSYQELSEALRAVNSIIHKCEKAQEKFPQGSTHHTLLKNRLNAMYISKTLLTEALEKVTPSVPQMANINSEELIQNLDQLHTTDLGVQRIKQNLNLDVLDVVTWCKEKIKSPQSHISRNGKNWYISVDECTITVNAKSYTIITAHPLRHRE